MNSLYTTLKTKGYTRVKLHFTKTNHIEIQGELNGILGVFIVDTGASNSCLGQESIEKFGINPQQSAVKATGAGTTEIDTQCAKNNHLQLGAWERKRVSLTIIDLQHINTALVSNNATPIEGIIGSDVLKRAKAIIDYNRGYLYLR